MRASSSRTLKAARVCARLPLFACLVLGCLAECLLRAAFRKLDAEARADVLHRWSGRILRRIGVQVFISGQVPAHGLIASNHLSYLDILVFSAIAPCVFVSKSEVRSWPLVGWIASFTGTVFVDRSSTSETHNVRPQMQTRLQAGARLVLFPEATSGDGRAVLPFHSSLFQAAVDVAAPAIAAYISYTMAPGDGDPVMDVCYWGDMTLFPHFIKLLTKAGVHTTVRFAEKALVFTNRKQAALEMQNQMLALAAAGRNDSPEVVGNTSPQMAPI